MSLRRAFCGLRRTVAVSLLALCCATCVPAETLTLATYNVENYVATDRMTSEGYRQAYPKPEAEKTALRRVMVRMKADVLVLQEMGDRRYLEELQRDLKQDGLDYPHVELLVGPDSDRHVAVLSNRRFSAVTPHPNLEFTYFKAKEKVKRGMLEVSLATSAGELTIFAIHLKSRFTDRADDLRSNLRREGEAKAVVEAILTRFPDPAQSLFVVLGDLNDDKSSKTLQRLAQRGRTKLLELVPIADSNGDSWTHWYKKEDTFSRVDHILISPGLSSAAAERNGRIEDGPGVREASDHRPVLITLTLPDKK